MKKSYLLLILSIFCFSVSAQRVTLDINQNYIPVITQKGDTLVSSVFSENHWVRNGVELTNERNQKLINPKAGTYVVYVIESHAGCITHSDPIKVLVDALPTVEEKEFSLDIYPNPNNGLFNVTIDSEKSEAMVLELLTVEGKKLAEKKFRHKSGKEVVQFGKANLPGGLYSVRIFIGTKQMVRKLIVK